MSSTVVKPQTRYFATVPPQEILPIVNRRYESSVKGIFVIGDVTGLPLVKIAANQGVDVIAKMESRGLFHRSDNDDGRLDLVIIGAGPAGLSAAMEAHQRGLKYVLLERNRMASTVRSFPPGKMVYAEPQFVRNESQIDFDDDLDKDEFLRRVQQAVGDKQLHVKEGVVVARVRKVSERQFEVETVDGKSFPTRQVLVAIGRQGQPRLLECPGADDAHKVTYRFHAPDDYHDANVMVVGGGNSAIEAALMLMAHNHVTLSYRGADLFRAKEENRRLIEQAERDGGITILYNSQIQAIRAHELDIAVDGKQRTLPNDHVIVQIGTLPPIDFLMDMGMELDGIWTPKRLALSIVGLLAGFFIYFFAKYFVLLPDAAGDGKWLLAGWPVLQNPLLLGSIRFLTGLVLPVAWLALLGWELINHNMRARGHQSILPVRYAKGWLVVGALLYTLSLIAPTVVTIDPSQAGDGPYYVPGLAWLYRIVPSYFSNAYGLYYLLYFSAIAGFGLYWAVRSNHRLIWRRNLTIIATQWTLWWGIPTFLAVYLGRNPWTPLLSRSLNAWPLNMGAFQVAPMVGPGDPVWWHTVAIVGVVWAAVLTFIVIPLVTIRWGKIYCSYICSCGALAETVGNGFRHRGPKGDTPRKWERIGFVFIGLACVATIADLYGLKGPLGLYNVWVGTALAGAVAIGLYPFLGQRVWCRMWCPLAFWMNFWGRWSKFKITPEKGKCIDCNVCNQYCQMGIDIKSKALKGEPITLKDSPCVGCNECIVRCPMEILHLGDLAETKQPKRSLPIVEPARFGPARPDVA